jgi:hypothetical protein
VGENATDYIPPEEKRAYYIVDSEDVDTIDTEIYTILFCNPTLTIDERDKLRDKNTFVIAEVDTVPTDSRWSGFLVRDNNHELTKQIREQFPDHFILVEAGAGSNLDPSVNGVYVTHNLGVHNLGFLYNQRKVSHTPYISVVSAEHDCKGAMKLARYMRWVYVGCIEGEMLCLQD